MKKKHLFVYGFAGKADILTKGRLTKKRTPESRRNILITIVMVLLLLPGFRAIAADRYAVVSGNWSSADTWADISGGTPGAGVPGAGDNVFIEGGFTVTLDENTAALALLNISSGSTFSASSAYTVTATTITVSGTYNNASTGAITVTTMTVNDGGTFIHANTGTALPTATWNTGSTCKVTGWVSGTVGSTFNQSFYNFTWDCLSQNANVSLGGYVSTVNGTFTLANTGSAGIYPDGNPTYGNYTQSGGVYYIAFLSSDNWTLTITNNFNISSGEFNQGWAAPGTLEVGGNYSNSGGVHRISISSSAQSVANIDGDFSMSSGIFIVTWNADTGILNVAGDFSMSDGLIHMSRSATGAGTLNLSGDFSHTGGTIDREVVGGSGTIVFNGTGTQIYTSGGTLVGTINFIVGSGSNLPVLQMGTGASPAVISSGSNGSFNLLEGATLGVTSADGISESGATGNIQVTGSRTFSAGAHYIYNGSVAQATGTGLMQNTPANITVNNSGGVNLSEETTISGVLTLTNGKINSGTYALVVADNSTSAISGGSSSSYVTGVLRRNIASGANNYSFPVGTATTYSPISFSFGAGTAAGYLNGSTTDGDHVNIGTSDIAVDKTVNRNWQFSVYSGLGSVDCNVTLNWAPSDQDAGFEYSSAIAGTYNGSSWSYPTIGTRNETNIQITGLTGFSDFQVGNLVVEPSLQASNVVFSNVITTGMTISWTKGDGERSLVLVKEGSDISSDPVDEASYTANTQFGLGQELGTGNFVVYSGTGSSVGITGLTPGTTYYVAVYEFNGSGGNENYLIGGPAKANQTTVDLYDYRSAASGNWNETTTWEYFYEASWTEPPSPPTYIANQITILNTHTVTVTADVTADQIIVESGAELAVSSGVTLTIANDAGTEYDLIVDGTIDNSGTLTTTGAMEVNNGGKYIHSSAVTTMPTATWNTGSTCEITGWTSATALTSSFSQTFYNFTWNCPGQTAILSFEGYASAVNGTFTLANTGSGSIYSGGNATYGYFSQTGGVYYVAYLSSTPRTITVTNNFSITSGEFNQGWTAPATLLVGGNYTNNGGVHRISIGSSSPSEMTVTGDFTLTSGVFIITWLADTGLLNVSGDFSMSDGILHMSRSDTGVGTLKVAGDFSHTGGTIDREVAGGSGSVIFNGTGTQTYNSGGTLSGTVNFTVGEGANLPTLQMGTGASPSIINSGSNGTFLILPGATLGITSADGISSSGATGNVQVTGLRSFSTGANYLYCATTNQNTGTGFPTDITGKLIINNTGSSGNNTVTLDNARSIANNGSVDLIAGILAAGTNLSMASTSAINRSTGFITGIPQGAGLYNVNYSGNSITTAEELTGAGLNSITVGLTAGQVLTLDQLRLLAGDLTVNSGTFDLGTYTCDRSTEGGTLTVAAGATLKVGGTNTIPANYSTHALAVTSTVEYYGGEQTVSPGTYGHLISGGTGTKTIASGSAVTVEGNLTTGDLLTVESNSLSSNGSLIVSTGTITGNVTYNRMLHNEAEAGDYHFFSSPVASNSNANTGKVTEVYGWDETTGAWPTMGTLTGLSSGVGYNLDQEATSDGLISFTGTVVTSDINIDASSPYSDVIDETVDDYSGREFAAGRDGTTNFGGGGWNLLGNPYTSAILVSDFIAQNTAAMDPNYLAVYLYDGTSGDHGRYYFLSSTALWPDGTYSSQTHIQAGQGFFVLAMNDNSVITFNRGMQDHGTGAVMLKSNAAKNYWPGLQLKAKSGNEESSTTVIFNDEMSNGLDPGYDVGMFSSGSEVEVYTALVKDNGVNFARQALSAYEGGRSSIAVGVDSENGGTVVFSGTVIPLRNRSFILEDRETGILTDLGKSTYTVTLPANTFGTGRFFIHASYDRDNRPKTDDPDLENMRIWSSFGRVNIQGQTGGMAICEVFNALGQKIFETRLTDPEYNSFSMPAEARGVHFVKVTDGAKITTRKVIFL